MIICCNIRHLFCCFCSARKLREDIQAAQEQLASMYALLDESKASLEDYKKLLGEVKGEMGEQMETG